MPILDGNWIFGLPALTDTTRTVSTNVVDVGSAKKVFAAPFCGFIVFEVAMVTVGATAGITVDLVGADNAPLTTNPVIINSSGIVATDEDGVTMVAGSIVRGDFPVGGQTKAKQFYGLMTQLAHVDSEIALAAKQGYFTVNPQTNMRKERAAVPA